MKTKIIPFDLETAKKIQAGEIAGRITTKNDRDVEILRFNRKSVSSAPIVALIHLHIAEDVVHLYTETGYISDMIGHSDLDLVLEVPDNEPQFKPFDKVLVRGTNNSLWVPRLFDRYQQSKKIYWCQDGCYYEFCIPYEGNQDLVGTTDKPKEE